MRQRFSWVPSSKWIRIPLGVGLLILGVIGLFLPVLQGILFLALGLYLLGLRFPWLERRLKRRRREAKTAEPPAVNSSPTVSAESDEVETSEFPPS